MDKKFIYRCERTCRHCERTCRHCERSEAIQNRISIENSSGLLR